MVDLDEMYPGLGGKIQSIFAKKFPAGSEQVTLNAWPLWMTIAFESSSSKRPVPKRLRVVAADKAKIESQ